ncbi:ferritin-like domain-containing protein [Cohnella sp. CFH 77786]|uniref:ferritin family protein n=1 Tax=Cohnella sp. CFH 77786 TaxID=2662265 RepID=UPI001C60D4EC|nr:ferritin-like domain-containing protein [Cohnella sp. CFH 77786]MBW5446038.1 ferritin-like domain-containing protein [Cohnella sp. CFH 77786]
MFDYLSIYERFPTDQGLLNDIAKAINGEYSAIACYERLAKLAPNEETRKRILEIRQDEIRHYQHFTQLYFRLSGRQPTPTMNEGCPAEYKAGLDFAYKDEQETVDFYLETADKSADRTVQEAFRRAAADEQNHAVWFLYFLMRS